MTEDSQEKEKLSFKEQILRDLANAKEEKTPHFSEEERVAQEEQLGLNESTFLAQQEEQVSIESGHDQASIDFEPLQPIEEPAVASSWEEETPNQVEADALPHPETMQLDVQPDGAFVEEKEYNTQMTKVSVSYTKEKTEEKEDVVAYGEVKKSDHLSRSNRVAQVEKSKKRQNRVAGKIVKTVLVLVLLAVIATGFFFYTFVSSALQPVDSKDTQFVTVQIPTGSSTKAIGEILEKNGLIKNAQIFNYYSKFNNYSNFQSGYYNLQKSMDLDSIAKKLQEGGTEEPEDPTKVRMTIPEGYTIDQIAQTVGATKMTKGQITSEDFLNKVQDEAFIAQVVSKYPRLLATLPTKESGVKYRLEGYLFPATYDLTEKSTAESLIEEMLMAMDNALASYYDTLASKNLTVNDVLTLASLVEKEGSTDQDRKDIASVFYNRLNQGIPLQSNIAILYAEGKLGQKTTLAEDAGINTNIDSPFNVYRNPGLMPGPVDSPSLSALEATINPSRTDYLYFVADVTTGTVYFSTNLEEHNRNVQEHVNSKLSQ